jgi:hypothetical protein
VSRFTVLGLGCGHYLAVAVEPGQAELQGGLGLQGAPLIHQLVTLQHDLLLQEDRACIEIGGSFRQSDRDPAGPLEDLPVHRAPALALGQGALVHHQVVTVHCQLLGAEEAAAAQEPAHITLGRAAKAQPSALAKRR